MHISFSSRRSEDVLTLERWGDCLVINGVSFDFTSLPEGGLLPQNAIQSLWFDGPVRREEGVIHVNIVLPHGAQGSRAQRFPEPLYLDCDGPVALPA